MFQLLLEILANSVLLAPTGHKVLRMFGIEAKKDDPLAIAA